MPTTPSYNDVDEKPTGHPMGSTFVQKGNKDIVDEGVGRDIQWANGNGYGSEKVDSFWHIDHHVNDPGESYKFDNEVARHMDVPSWNMHNTEPLSHPNGFTGNA